MDVWGRVSAIVLPACLISQYKFHNYFADFPQLQEAEAAACERLITKCEVRDALKQVVLNKSPRLGGLLYKVYLRMLLMFIPNLADTVNHWFA